MLAAFIFLLTLTLVIWQPKLKWQPGGLGIGYSAAFGALLALMTGVVNVSDIPVVWNIVWNATATFVALIIISLLLDEAGFFKWAALHVARWGGGNGHKLFALVVLLGAAVSGMNPSDRTTGQVTSPWSAGTLTTPRRSPDARTQPHPRFQT